MTNQISIDEELGEIDITIDDESSLPRGVRRLYLAALGTVAMTGDKVGSMVEGAFGPTFDRLVERGEVVERDKLRPLAKPAHESLDAATDAGRQATRMASSTATTVAGETRKQVILASTSVLEALSRQVEALRGSVDELRKTIPQTEAEDEDAQG